MPADGNSITEAAQQRADDGTHALKGVGLAEDSTNLLKQVVGGEWTQGLVSLASAGFEVKDFLQDPLAKLISSGLGWVIEFFEPLKACLDGLVGDDERLALAAETWTGISDELAQVAQDLDTTYRNDTAHWSGPAVDQYRLFCADRVELYKAGSNAAAATAATITQCKAILAMVREIVRNLITDAVGRVISIVCRYPPPATPAAAGEVTVTVVQYSNTITGWVRRLQGAFANAGQLLKDSKGLFADLHFAFTKFSLSNATRVVTHGVTRDVVSGAKAAVKEMPMSAYEDFVVGGTKAGAEIHKDDDVR